MRITSPCCHYCFVVIMMHYAIFSAIFIFKGAADESIAFATTFSESTWFSFKMTGRSDKGFLAATDGETTGFKVCDVTKLKEPQSLLISRFIQPTDLVERIMLDIQYALQGEKKNLNLKVGVVETSQPIHFNQYSDASFNTIKGHFGSNWLTLSDYLELELTKKRSGFHIAFLDLGSCLTLQSMQIKYLFCPDMMANLTRFDRTTTFVSAVEGRCVDNAKSSRFPENNCKSSGDWRKKTPDGDCLCDPGFEPDLNFEECKVCPEDYYKPASGNDRCRRCPRNSERISYKFTRLESTPAVRCECTKNYFRRNDEGVDTPCTTVPTKPLGLRVEVMYTSFALSWRRPNYNGDRSDMFYEVRICLAGIECRPVQLRSDVTSYSATEFSPEQRYTIKVCAMNGVSDKLRKEALERQSCEIYSETTGKELKVNNLELVPERETIAIKWDKPDVPVANDDLLNYSITVYLHGSTFSHVTTAKTKAAFSSLTSGEYTFSVVARYDGQNGPATNLTQRIQGLVDPRAQIGLFTTPDPGVMLMIGVVVIVLLILITIFVSAVCILRKKHAEWEKSMPHGRAFMEYETNKAHPRNYLGYGSGSSAPYDFTAVPVGQTFIDPHYYNLEEMMLEYTLQVEPTTIHLEASHEAVMLESGFFGSAGSYTSPDHFPAKHPVFVKMCKQKESDQFKELFFMESVILGQFNHPNVLQLHGISVKSDPMMMVTEHTTGTMVDYLSLIYNHQMATGKMAGDGFSLPPGQIVHQMRGVACGMQYLSELGYVHKVLCSKNILVSQNEVCKITGFDQRILLDQEQQLFGEAGVSSDILPWTAPEAYNLRKFSTQSDSWSFGVTLWEIFSFPAAEHQRPYFGRTNNEITRLVDSGYRLPAPGSCPVILYELMKACWNLDRSKRPDFALIQEQLHHMIRRQDLLQETIASVNMKSVAGLSTGTLNPLNLQNSPANSIGLNTANYFTLPMTHQSPITASDWLISIKLSQYADLFTKNSILTTEDVLMSVDSSVLEQMGVTSAKHRKKIVEAIGKLKKQQGASNISTTSFSSNLTKQNLSIDMLNEGANANNALQTAAVFSEI